MYVFMYQAVTYLYMWANGNLTKEYALIAEWSPCQTLQTESYPIMSY